MSWYSLIVGSFYVQIDDSVEKALKLFSSYLELLGFKQKNDNVYVLHKYNVYVKIIEKSRFHLKIHISVETFNLRYKIHIELVDFSDVEMSDDNILFIPKIEWAMTKLSQDDLLFSDDIGKLLSEGRLINPRIVVKDTTVQVDYGTINILIVFSALVVSFYFAFILLLKNAYNRVSQDLRNFTAIATHDRYVPLKELTQEFNRWREKLNKLNHFLDCNFYRISGRLLDSTCFKTVSEDLYTIIKDRYTKFEKELIIPIEDLTNLYTGRISEKSAIVGGIIGAIIGVILTLLKHS